MLSLISNFITHICEQKYINVEFMKYIVLINTKFLREILFFKNIREKILFFGSPFNYKKIHQVLFDSNEEYKKFFFKHIIVSYEIDCVHINMFKMYSKGTCFKNSLSQSL